VVIKETDGDYWGKGLREQK